MLGWWRRSAAIIAHLPYRISAYHRRVIAATAAGRCTSNWRPNHVEGLGLELAAHALAVGAALRVVVAGELRDEVVKPGAVERIHAQQVLPGDGGKAAGHA